MLNDYQRQHPAAIEMRLRYPDSKQEDITDAFTRGYVAATEASKRKIEKLAAENARLLMLIGVAWRCAHTGPSCSDCRLMAGGCTLQSAMRELGVDV